MNEIFQPYSGERCRYCDYGFHDGQATCWDEQEQPYHVKCKIDYATIARLTAERDEALDDLDIVQSARTWLSWSSETQSQTIAQDQELLRRQYEIIARLTAERDELRELLRDAMPWIGVRPDVRWATPEARVRNREMCEAIKARVASAADPHSSDPEGGV